MSNIFPIPRPPVHPGWCGHPGHPDWCDCGCGGPPVCPPSTVDAWREMSRFKDMLRCIIDEMGITAKPIQGVIDGSDAKPGEVGEFIRGQSTVNFAANPTVTTTNVQPLVVPPGDWDLFGIVTVSVPIGILYVAVSPRPAGLSDSLTAQEGVTGMSSTSAFAGTANIGSLAMNTVRGNFTVPTLLSFSVTVDQSANTSLGAGVANVFISGRRVR